MYGEHETRRAQHRQHARLVRALRHAVQLLTPSLVLAQTNGRDQIEAGDVEDSTGLFRDAKASAKLLAEQADKFIT